MADTATLSEDVFSTPLKIEATTIRQTLRTSETTLWTILSFHGAPPRLRIRQLAETDPGALMEWIPRLQHPDQAIAAEYLGSFAAPSDAVAQFLVAMTKHESALIRERATAGLAKQPGAVATARLRQLAETDPVDAVRETARDALELRDE